MGSATKRVLIYRLGSLGDTLIALPALHLVARAFPNAERRLLTNFPVNAKAPPAAAILENTGLVHSYIRYAVGTRSPRELLSLWWELLRWRPEVLVYMGSARGVESAIRDAKFFRLCGISRLIGVPITEDMQQNRWQDSAQVSRTRSIPPRPQSFRAGRSQPRRARKLGPASHRGRERTGKGSARHPPPAIPSSPSA